MNSKLKTTESIVNITATILTFFVGFITVFILFCGYLNDRKKYREELARDRNRKSFERFLKIRNSLDEKIKSAVYSDRLDIIKNLTHGERVNFMGQIGIVATMVNSRFISKEVAFYFFGNLTIETYRIFKETEMADEINTIWWCVFRKFVDDMRKVEKYYENQPDLLARRVAFFDLNDEAHTDDRDLSSISISSLSSLDSSTGSTSSSLSYSSS